MVMLLKMNLTNSKPLMQPILKVKNMPPDRKQNVRIGSVILSLIYKEADTHAVNFSPRDIDTFVAYAAGDCNFDNNLIMYYWLVVLNDNSYALVVGKKHKQTKATIQIMYMKSDVVNITQFINLYVVQQFQEELKRQLLEYLDEVGYTVHR